ncbi:hypothetical protein BJX62DRAFT_132052 [Aspergillus germanicus]
MDRFLYLDEYRVLICKQCAYAVPPTYLTSHLKRHLHQYSGFENRAALSALEKQLRGFSLVNPLEESVVFPGPDRPPLPGVPLHNGFRCRDCFYITTSLTWIKQHTQSHQPIRKGRGRPRKFASASLYQTQPLWDNIYCQRFFVSGPQSQYFQVTPSLHPAATSQADLIRDQVSQRVPQAAPTGGRATAARDPTRLGLTPLGQVPNDSLGIAVHKRPLQSLVLLFPSDSFLNQLAYSSSFLFRTSFVARRLVAC